MVVFIGLLVALVSGIIDKSKKNLEVTERIARLPDFCFLTIDRDTLNSSDIEYGPLLIIHFNTECEHCEYEIESIIKSELPYMDCRVLLITDSPIDSIKEFYNTYKLDRYLSFSVLVDTSFMFGEIFGSYSYPLNYIYNRNLELVKILKGEYKTETIIKYLAECE